MAAEEQLGEVQHTEGMNKEVSTVDVAVPDDLMQRIIDQNMQRCALLLINLCVFNMASALCAIQNVDAMNLGLDRCHRFHYFHLWERVFGTGLWRAWLVIAVVLIFLLLALTRPRQMQSWCFVFTFLASIDHVLPYILAYVWSENEFIFCSVSDTWTLLVVTALALCLPTYRHARHGVLWIFSCIVAGEVACLCHLSEHGHKTSWHFQSYLIDRVLLLVLICTCALGALQQRDSLEQAELGAVKLELRRKDAAGKLRDLLGTMLPSFALQPVLESEDKRHSYRADCVSVLFVVIEDFETLSKSMSPVELLGFLNMVFIKLDALCEKHRVTKIETFNEELVCAVGVSPEDIQLNARHGHRCILERLLFVACDILSESAVTFKLGIHTGPVVAGIVGDKLPRFRLFGDTVNTAARMMQTGLPGKVQFGEETRTHLPAWTAPIARGNIKMKGKGTVMTYISSFSAASAHMSHRHGAECPGQTTKEMIVVNVDLTAGIATEAAKSTATSSFCHVVVRQAMAVPYSTWFYSTFAHDYTGHSMMLETCYVLALTGVEVLYCLINRSLASDPLNLMFLLFLACRAAWCINIWAWQASRDHLRLFAEKTWVANVLCQSITLNVMLLSYAGLLEFSSTRFSTGAPTDLLTKSFVATYLRAISICLRFRFKHACIAFLLHAIPAYGIQKYLSLNDSVIIGQLFVLLTFNCCVLCVTWWVENCARNQWHALLCISKNSCRMQHILMTLLPPLVVEECVRGPAASSHQEVIGNVSHGYSPCLTMTNDPRLLNQVSHDYREAIVVQSDLCGFTQLANSMPPEDVVELVNDIFSRFDNLAEKRRVCKIETKGDAYYAGQAEAPLTAQRSALEVISFGLDMLAAVREWPRGRRLQLTCRVGIHYGECIGGVVGNKMKRYHLFGRLMTVLDLLESTSPEGCLQASEACVQAAEKELGKNAFANAASLVFEKRTEPVLITSKGAIHQYDEVGGPTFLIKTHL